MKGRVLFLVLIVVTVNTASYFGMQGHNSRQNEEAGPTETKVLSVHYPRPLAEGALFLTGQLGLAVSYEDPAWSFAPDIETNGESPNRSPNMKPHVLGPVYGTLELQIPISTRTLRPIDSPEFLLERLLAEHVHRKNAGEFRFVQAGDGFAIIPSRCSDRERKLADCGSPLDTLISFPEEEREARATVMLILQTVKNITGHNIVISEMNSYVLGGGKVTLGAKNEVARDVLAKAFKQIRYPDARLPVQTAWSMFYDANDRVYVFNLREVAAMKRMGGGGVRQEPVFVTRP